MTKLKAFACSFAFSIAASSQPVLLGMLKKGGSAQTGTIISYTISSGNLPVLHNFEGVETSGACKLMKATNGKLYGTISYGRYGYGAIYSFDPNTNTYTSLFDFNGTHGSGPNSLMQASNGKLYGTAGVLYSFDPLTNEYNKLVDINALIGPGATGLVQATNGKLYGTTYNGGTNNHGTVYSFDPATNLFEKLHALDGTNGSHPTGSLLQATNGLLYGMTEHGGRWNRGVIYSFNPAAGTFVKLIDFDGTNGTNPTAYASLIQASNGKLYGMTYLGGSYGTYGVGVVFSFDPTTNQCKSVKDFDVANGSGPYGSLTETGNGRLYGMCSKGGATDDGVLFSIDLLTNNFTKEKDFEISTGGRPLSNLVPANDGKLYGANSRNAIGFGDNHSTYFGNLFSFDPVLQTYSVLKTFGENTNGSFASAGLTKASDGKYYGTTIDGGNKGFGVLFAFDPISNTYTNLYDFSEATGGNPQGSLTESGGVLYGMTQLGGSSNRGVLFAFKPATKTYQNVKDFSGVDGANPYGSLLLSGNKLYGMTKNGGEQNFGVIFAYDLASNVYTKLWNFDKPTGASPFGSLVRANNNKLYGMTYEGGSSNLGVIFSFDPTTTVYTKLKDFDGFTGAQPYGGLLLAKNGKLYGMTLRGGRSAVKGGTGSAYSEYGLIFSFDPANQTFTKVKELDNTNGANPNGSLMQASNDKLYGMTTGGGAYNKGVLFSVDLTSKNPYTKLKDFDGTNGANPSLGSFLVEMSNYSATLTTNYIPVTTITEKTFLLNEDKLTVSALPNPTQGEFILRTKSFSSQHLQVRVLDLIGRTVEVRNNVTANAPVFLGSEFRSGVYFVEVVQGRKKVTVKLIKGN